MRVAFVFDLKNVKTITIYLIFFTRTVLCKYLVCADNKVKILEIK